MERKLSPYEKRTEQNIFGMLLIFTGAYMFFKGNADVLTFGILLILGFGASKDSRNFVIFLLKYLFAKLSNKSTPAYDFSRAEIKQKSGRDSIINYGTINMHSDKK